MGLTRVLCGQAVAVGGLVLTFVIVIIVYSTCDCGEWLF